MRFNIGVLTDILEQTRNFMVHLTPGQKISEISDEKIREDKQRFQKSSKTQKKQKRQKKHKKKSLIALYSWRFD